MRTDRETGEKTIIHLNDPKNEDDNDDENGDKSENDSGRCVSHKYSQNKDLLLPYLNLVAKKYQLSKSTFLRGLKCEKSLYLYKHHYDTKDDVSNTQQAILIKGTKAGILAQRFPKWSGCVARRSPVYRGSAPKTLELIRQGETVIYEATFIYDEVLVALDILVKDEEGWKAYEVKGSTSVKDTHIHDAAIQFYALSHAGIDLKDISIVHINSDYVRNGPIDINELFTIQSVYDDIQSLLPNIPSQAVGLNPSLPNPTFQK